MTTLARIFIALFVCPTMGGFVGQAASRALGAMAKAEAGVLARWEVVGLLVGVVLGVLYAALLIRCVVGFQGQLRRRIADPVILALGMAGVIGMLMRRATLPPAVGQLETAITVLVWLLGFAFVIMAVRLRPRGTSATQPPPAVGEPGRWEGG